jgi:hypothetical protein
MRPNDAFSSQVGSLGGSENVTSDALVIRAAEQPARINFYSILQMKQKKRRA